MKGLFYSRTRGFFIEEIESEEIGMDIEINLGVSFLGKQEEIEQEMKNHLKSK